ncbi:HAD-IA family hydrolase [Treponema brennaborense]|uniref:HAD-superfamily hydrolase, subfamily IA, variant 3 n=1 Tax=Treponema brennaborense (strain DSM 12168 / CIP 105900 / DD5/3) TaxID=906968 RepID=F4LP16_TREBD|nr:HAD-IA family hydrolase [Treponema brennaborense]AEE15892.1 HAD-superfamily hydrolase, subfamily IA, variant 3 [Treponema brennaborense DSM 12168]
MFTHLLLDLDNTLYPASAAMDRGITTRMLHFTAELLGVSYEQAVKERERRLPNYGTTLEWLRSEHGLTDTDAYFAAVHPPQEIEELTPDPHLRSLLQSFALPMTVLTNAPEIHALRVLDFLNVADLFTGIYDIQSNGFKGKPYPQAYLTAIEGAGSTVSETLFFDDHKKYTDGYVHIGGTAVLVKQQSGIDSAVSQVHADSDAKTYVISSVYDIPALLARLARSH